MSLPAAFACNRMLRIPKHVTRAVQILGPIAVVCAMPVSSLYAATSAAAGASAAQSPANDGVAIATVETAFTCESANKLKFNEAEFRKLDPTARMLLDAQWLKCDLLEQQKRASPEQNPNAQTVVVLANPAPTKESSKVFYGLIKRNDLANAEKNCAGGGKAVGIALTVVGAATGADGTGQLGRAIYTYSGVSCKSLKDSISSGNVMAFLGPEKIVGHAIQRKLTHEVLKNIPLVSDADKKNIEEVLGKSTKPPEVSITKKGEVEIKAGPAKIRFNPKKPFG